jgi:ArsR family metal-binding transcriptional regulator
MILCGLELIISIYCIYYEKKNKILLNDFKLIISIYCKFQLACRKKKQSDNFQKRIKLNQIILCSLGLIISVYIYAMEILG